jgi:hypothetical protein
LEAGSKILIDLDFTKVFLDIFQTHMLSATELGAKCGLFSLGPAQLRWTAEAAAVVTARLLSLALESAGSEGLNGDLALSDIRSHSHKYSINNILIIFRLMCLMIK